MQYQTDQYEKQRVFKIIGGFLVVIIAFLLLNTPDDDNTTILTDYAAKQYGIKTKQENLTIFKDA